MILFSKICSPGIKNKWPTNTLCFKKVEIIQTYQFDPSITSINPQGIRSQNLTDPVQNEVWFSSITCIA